MKKIFTLMIMVSAILAFNSASATTIERERPIDNKYYSNNDEKVEGSANELYKIYFDANEKVNISVMGDGDTDLDLYIFDEDENLVAFDTDYTDKCTCNFTTETSGNYIIVVKNCGTFVNYYSLNIY